MQRFHLSLFLAAIFKAEWSKLKFSKDDFPYKKFWLDWARFGPDSGHKVIFKARTERDKARHLSGFFIADNMAWVSEKYDNQVYTNRDICQAALSVLLWAISNTINIYFDRDICQARLSAILHTLWHEKFKLQIYHAGLQLQ